MAFWHISNNGTNTTYTGQVSRTWPAVSLQYNISNLQTVIDNIADSDEIVFDDDTFSIPTTFNDDANAVNGGTLYIGSRSNTADTCIFDLAATAIRVFQFNDTTNVKNWIVSNIKIAGSVANTDTRGPKAVLIGNQTGNVTFNSVIFGPFTLTSAIPGNVGQIIHSQGDARTVTLNNCSFSAIISRSSNRQGGYIRTNTGDNLISANCSHMNCSMTSTSLGADGIYHLNGDATITNPIFIKCDCIVAVGRNATYGLINCQGSNTVTITNPNFSNCDFTNGTVHAFGVYCEGTWTVTGLRANNCTITSDDDCLGGAMLSYGSNADGTYNDARVINCTTALGPAFYNSQGGSGTINQLYADSNTAAGYSANPGTGGAIYS